MNLETKLFRYEKNTPFLNKPQQIISFSLESQRSILKLSIHFLSLGRANLEEGYATDVSIYIDITRKELDCRLHIQI